MRGMGAGQLCACQDQVPGIPLIPNLAICDPATGNAPGCSTAEQNTPYCAGIPYGQPGYAQCIAAASQTTTVGAIGPQVPVNPAPYQAIIASLPAPPPAAPAPPAPSAPAQSNAPNPAPVGNSNPTQVPVQSNAPAPTYAAPTYSTPAGCFTLFGNEPCLGPVGLYTLLAGAGVLFGAMALFGGHR
jgi:hypothetical protein